MKELLLDGRAIDAILMLVALEAIVLSAIRLFWRRGPATVSLIGNLLSGAFLLIALRNAMTGGSPTMICLCLIGALFAHLADLVARWDAPLAQRTAVDAHARFRTTLSLRVDNPRIRPAPGAPASESSDE